MPSGTNRLILSQETLKAGKNGGKKVQAGYAKRVKNSNNEVKSAIGKK